MLEKPVSLRILFAEDDDALRSALSAILIADAGYRVEGCASGEEAIELLKQQQFDIVLLDHKMPGLTGLNVLQWMHEQKMETPVVMLTGAGTEVIAVEAMKLGAYDYVRKEHVEIEHLPVVLNGVYERYLFKKEREYITRVEQRNLERMDTFKETISSVTGILESVLAAMSANLETYERELDRHIQTGGHQQLVDAFARIKQDHSVIAFAISSILHSATGLYDTFRTENVRPQQEVVNVISP